MLLKPTTTIILFVLLSFSFAKAQQQIRGIVSEKSTNKPVAFATVQAEGAKNTLTNENGEFEISIPTLPATVRISHLNYTGVEIRVSNAAQRLTIPLDTRTLVLNEVSVGNPAIAIMQDVSDKARRSAEDPYYSKAFLRQIAYSNGKPGYVNEIFFNAEWKPYFLSSWQPTQSRQLKSGKGISYDNFSFFLFMISGYLPNSQHNKPLSKKVDSIYNYKLVGTYDQNGQEIAKISCTPKKNLEKLTFVGNYYVNTVTNDVIKIEGTFSGMKFNATGPASIKNKELIYSAQYKTNSDGKNVLDYVMLNTTNRLKVLGLGVETTQLYSVLYMIEEDKNVNIKDLTPVIQKIKDAELIKKMVYNDDFWKKNQGIKRTEAEQTAIEFLEKIPQVKK